MPEMNVKAKFIQSNFDRIAEKYDLFNDIGTFCLHRLWKNEMLKLIKKQNFHSPICLDLCCGSGDISVRLHSLKGTVYSVDFSEQMLSIAKARLIKYPNSIVQHGDATNLHQFSDNQFDVITVGFGLRNVDNLSKALDEIYRVLKPNGIFVNLDVGKVTIPVIREIANFYFFKIVPKISFLVYGKKDEMFEYLPISSLYYPDQKKLKLMLESTGFQNVVYKNFVFGNTTLHIGTK